MTKRPTVELRVLSVKQPWADCLMLDKWVENRIWGTKYRGPLWIQAGLQPVREPEEGHRFWHVAGDRLRGHIIGRVDLVDCVEPDDITAVWKYVTGKRKTLNDRQREVLKLVPRRKLSLWDHCNPDDYAWIVANPRRLRDPIPCAGKLGIFKFQADPESIKMRRRAIEDAMTR